MLGERGSRREGTIARFTDTILNVVSLLLVGVGVAVAATFFVASPQPDAEAASTKTVEEKKVEKTVEEKAAGGGLAGQPEIPAVAPKVEKEPEKRGGGEREVKRRRIVVRGPEKKMLRVTIPGMDQLRNSKVPYAASDDEDAFRKYAGVHLRGTGNPWDRVANVYIAGHRLGYPATDSFLAFWDLNVLGEGRQGLRDRRGRQAVRLQGVQGVRRAADPGLRDAAARGQERPDAPDLHAAGLLAALDRPGRKGGSHLMTDIEGGR